jgi:hypothetical protein
MDLYHLSNGHSLEIGHWVWILDIEAEHEVRSERILVIGADHKVRSDRVSPGSI